MSSSQYNNSSTPNRETHNDNQTETDFLMANVDGGAAAGTNDNRMDGDYPFYSLSSSPVPAYTSLPRPQQSQTTIRATNTQSNSGVRYDDPHTPMEFIPMNSFPSVPEDVYQRLPLPFGSSTTDTSNPNFLPHLTSSSAVNLTPQHVPSNVYQNDLKSRLSVVLDPKKIVSRFSYYFGGAKKETPSRPLNRIIPVVPLRNTPLINPATGKAFAPNTITTARYTIWSFLPAQLYFQFSRVANIYFLFVAALQMVPGWSPTGQYTTIIPLAAFISIAMAREGYDDLRRHNQDREENNKETLILRNYVSGGVPTTVWQRAKWKDVSVGDIVKVEQNEWIPADLLLLSVRSADPTIAYIETAALDGEINLKQRLALPQTAHILQTPESLAQLDAIIGTEQPNNDLYNFEGYLRLRNPDGPRLPLTQAQLLLRGTILRNTPSVHGLVIFTGKETKIRQNATRNVKAKAPSIQRHINRVVIIMFAFVLTLSGYCSFMAGLWNNAASIRDKWYIRVPDFRDNITSLAFAFIILYNTMIPISLYVTMEIVKLTQASFIGSDAAMYDPVSDTPARSNTATINEELGQVSYVFTDKTGTLTENKMIFRKCAVGGLAYYRDIPGERLEREESLRSVEGGEGGIGKRGSIHRSRRFPKRTASTSSSVEIGGAHTRKPHEHIRSIAQLLRGVSSSTNGALGPTSARSRFFLLALALCHTAIPDTDPLTGEISYQSASPDESALVTAAVEMGFRVIMRTTNSLTVETPSLSPDGDSETVTFDILNVIEFSSERRRMSVIVRLPTGEIVLFCKGADSVILERSWVPSEAEVKKNQRIGDGYTTSWDAESYRSNSIGGSYNHEDITVTSYARAVDVKPAQMSVEIERTLALVQDFASEGLRTLFYAHRFLSKTEYEEWNTLWYEASHSIVNRAGNLGSVAEMIERDLVLTGATAIEDKLQKGVPDAIERLRCAGMKVWMLTGDKRETAIQIGYSCRLMKEHSSLIILDEALGSDSLAEHMELALTNIQKGVAIEPVLVVDGATLAMLEKDTRLMQLFCHVGIVCTSVICCRVSPSQKALVVRVVRETDAHGVTLAIGDGGNDIAMIQEAHVGIGITGQEGMQAARSADYAIAQFRFLVRLLLVHGRWNYVRISKFVLGTFYKCQVFYMTQFLYQFFCGFSGTSLYESWSLSFYNTLFSSLPVIIIGIFEKDLNAASLIANPQLYQTMGPKDKAFNLRVFFATMTTAWFHAIAIVLLPILYYGVEKYSILPESPQIYTFGVTLYTSVVIIVTVKIAFIDTHNQSVVTWLTAWMEFGAWFLYQILYNFLYPSKSSYEYAVRGDFLLLGRNSSFWLGIILIVSIALLPLVAWKVFKNALRPDDLMLFQELEKDPVIMQGWEVEATEQMIGFANAGGRTTLDDIKLEPVTEGV